MASYASQEDAIYDRATQMGISQDLVYDYFDQMIDHVTAQYPDKSADARLEKAEELVWGHFFPKARFPGLNAHESLNPTRRLSKTESLQTHPNGAKSFTGSVVFDTPSSPHPLPPRSLIKNEPLESPGSYASQSKLITSKAINLRLQMNDFQAIFNKKTQIAQSRFPGESVDWQNWYAESMVWGSYFNAEPFPGVEPTRLFPLRSSTEPAQKIGVAGSGSGRKWVKFADPSCSAGTGANSTMIDSYRPSDSVAWTKAVDSYRPGVTDPMDRSVGVNNSSGHPELAAPLLNRSASMNVTSSLGPQKPTSLSNRSTAVNNPSTMPRQRIAPAASLNRSAGVSNSTGSVSHEKLMERKSIKLGIRREFFQYLQIARDQVRREHPNCSSQYKHWAADTMVWAKFFNREPFPTAEPRGADLHAGRCPTILAQTLQSLGQPERLGGPPALQASSSLTSPERMSAPAVGSQPAVQSRSLSSTQGPGMKDIRLQSNMPAPKLLNSSQRSSQPEIKPTPPFPLSLELSIKRAALPVVSKETRAIMINKDITWTTAATVKMIADSFSTIDSALLDVVENELKCHLRSCKTLNGDLILWCEGFISDDAAFERGNKFLNRWLDTNRSLQPSSFMACYEEFLKFERLDLDPLNKVNESENLDTDHSKKLNDSNTQAAENDWEKYASAFQVTDLDRMMIEAAAKAEGSMRLVVDEISGEVVGLAEYTRRVVDRTKDNRSVKVRSQSRSEDLNDSDQVSKRKAEDDEHESGQEGKRAKL